MPTRKYRRSHKHKQRNRRLILIAVFLIVAVSAVVMFFSFGGNGIKADRVLLETSMGDIVIELYNYRPITTGNFKNLVRQGVYDGTVFHRVIDDFMIQGGDPTGTGHGDPSIPAIRDELTGNNRNDRGTIAMANKGAPDTGSSQFFINLVDNNYLDNNHTVFGRVLEGMDVVDNIGRVETDGEPYHRPLEDVVLTKAELTD